MKIIQPHRCFRLAAEFRESHRNGTQEFLVKRWQREIEAPLSDPNLTCLIEPLKIHELTIAFFQRELANSAYVNGLGLASSVTRSVTCPRSM